MNIFRFAGDSSHLIAIVILIVKIWKTRSCAGLSGKSQLLFAFVFTSRYLDLFNFISSYNTIMKKSRYISDRILNYSGSSTCFSHQPSVFIHGGWLCFFAISENEYPGTTPVTITRVLGFVLIEISWSFSIYLEAVAIMPQLFMLSRTGSAETITAHYLFALGTYRALYILNWVYRYYTEEFFDPIATVAGVVQTVLYADFFYLYITRVCVAASLYNLFATVVYLVIRGHKNLELPA
ncbi:unnamed protein product [Litomosoides sigmodontis]|uniref:ER lumen protein-retaining receptor n=1 Tax=Litomosoides sigmodontis TaxID=42156 RepID=A0A3P6SI52_LITSI|nr:unnamed protein product [Litomosoides sigmodontis]